MKRILLLLTLFLSGCVVSQDEVQTLKVKVINLETRLAKQEQKYQELEKEVFKNLETKLLDLKAQLLSEVEEIKREQTELAGKIEDLQFKSEERDREYLGKLKELNLKIETLEIKLSSLQPLENATNATKIEKATFKDNVTKTDNVTKIDNATKTDNVTKIDNATPVDRVTKIGHETSKVSKETKALSEDELFQKAYSLFQKGDYKGARATWEEYLRRFPKGKWIGQAYFGIGETYFKEKNYEDAILSYQKLVELKGPHPQKPAALLKQAQAFKALGDQKAYQILLKKIIREFPTSKEALEAKKLLAR
ncbi:MAG: tetratricopeptide repeat protein [Thermodesulfobacterium sp.]|nr:tetratricopeptide repeat protein [Thermodesulfobacterium sp.]